VWSNSWARQSYRARTQWGADPLPPGQVWTVSPGGMDEYTDLYRVEINEGPGSGVRILNRQPPLPPFVESVRFAEQNLYARTKELVGDRDLRSHEFNVQLRSFDSSRGGSQIGVAVLIALCSALLKRHVRGGLIVVGGINLGGSIEPVYNAVLAFSISCSARCRAVPTLIGISRTSRQWQPSGIWNRIAIRERGLAVGHRSP
jgi:ATP-dependent Lon protease